jgi:pyruvate-ferredoxin/flavodoxin oxidoreductase
MSYGNVYVARVAMGANDAQAVRAMMEAERYNGPSIIIAYAHCIAHGIDMGKGLTNQKLAVETGYWPLFRYNPALEAEGKNPFTMDSKAPKTPLSEFTSREDRFKVLEKIDPVRARELAAEEQQDIMTRWKIYDNFTRNGESPSPDR